MSIEERKENRMMMGQVVINSGKVAGGPRFQQAGAGVMANNASAQYKAAMTDDRRNTIGGAG
jgi:hypothetical protein